ncbi:MAG: hypothetical protein HC769_22555 [Cyanobacteria bacterium CRU_2_1]|nr:hypothetical protein [Cyanobacteria bacterium CRU_2_1]
MPDKFTGIHRSHSTTSANQGDSRLSRSIQKLTRRASFFQTIVPTWCSSGVFINLFRSNGALLPNSLCGMLPLYLRLAGESLLWHCQI